MSETNGPAEGVTPGRTLSGALDSLLRSWIPPFGILFGLLAFLFAWVILFFAGKGMTPRAGIPVRLELVWIHTMAIGFMTVTAISVLFHVMPAFTGTSWKHERIARNTLPPLALGFLGMTGSFLTRNASFWAWGFVLAAGAILLWVGLFFYSLLEGRTRLRDAGSPMALFLIPVGFLALTATLGLSMGMLLAFPPTPSWIFVRGIPVHMASGLLGWLTALLWIVSSRTRRPILGTRSPNPAWLPVALALLAGGLILFLLGRLWMNGLVQKGGGLLAGAGILLELADSVRLLRRASSPHPVLWAWWATGVAGLSGSLIAGATVLLTNAPRAPELFVYLLLAGWVQPFLLGHLHQIGVRLLATLVRGPEDQTPPVRLLSTPLSWGFWGLTLLAILAGLWGTGAGSGPLLELSGILGILSSGLLLLHLVRMIDRCRKLPSAPPPRPTLIQFPPRP